MFSNSDSDEVNGPHPPPDERLPRMGVSQGRPIRVMHVIARMNVGGPAVEITELMRGLDPAVISQRLHGRLELAARGSRCGMRIARAPIAGVMFAIEVIIVPLFVIFFNLPFLQPMIILIVILGTIGYGGVGTLRAKIQGGNNNWDVVQVESEELLLGCEEGLFENTNVQVMYS